MAVLRINANILADDPKRAEQFYAGIVGMDTAFDMGWIRTYQSDQTGHPQLTFATEGGNGTPLPAISIEVDNLEEVLQRVRSAGIPIEYGPVDEPWGLRRFFVRDPFGTLVNILQH